MTFLQTLADAFAYASSHGDELLGAVGDHLLLVAAALGISLAICLPLGIWTSRSRIANLTFINLVNSLRVVPSLAVLFLAIPIPFLGLSTRSAVLALVLLALPPLLINIDTAFRTIPPAVREAARGMGMTPTQSLLRVETPLALPVILAGVRTATTEVIASATLAAFIGAGGLGLYIVRGFALYDIPILLVGAIPVALLTLIAELGLSRAQRALEPPT